MNEVPIKATRQALRRPGEGFPGLKLYSDPRHMLSASLLQREEHNLSGAALSCVDNQSAVLDLDISNMLPVEKTFKLQNLSTW